jgi:hypothetical protein
MNKLPLKSEFFTKVSYVKNEPKIAIVPFGMPNYELAIPIGENPDAGFEGKVTIADNSGEIMNLQIKQFGYESIVAISAAYKLLQATYGEEFEEFLTAATHAAIEERWSEFPMYFPTPKKQVD